MYVTLTPALLAYASIIAQLAILDNLVKVVAVPEHQQGQVSFVQHTNVVRATASAAVQSAKPTAPLGLVFVLTAKSLHHAPFDHTGLYIETAELQGYGVPMITAGPKATIQFYQLHAAIVLSWAFLVNRSR